MKSLRPTASALASIALLLTSVAISSLIGEGVIRYIDGYALTTLRLVSHVPATTSGERHEVARQYIPSIALAPHMRAEWFDVSPPPLAHGPTDSVLTEALSRFAARGIGSSAAYVFNWHFVRHQLCSTNHFQNLPGFLFLFDAPAGAEHPRYRYPRNAVAPDGLVTNQFGWRGSAIELQKPARTIRLAFVGASTTVNDHSYPHSYPELTGFWLNLWLQERHPNLRIEVINAGREGIGSTDIAAIVRDEVLPLNPDLVIYYEGANQFTLENIVRFPPHRRSLYRSMQKRITELEPFSALARRLAELIRVDRNLRIVAPGDGSEPAKRDYSLLWPEGADEKDPPLRHPRLPGNLALIIRDLDDMLLRTRLSGGAFVVSSFFWLVYDGMKLDRERDHFIYDYLNSESRNARLSPYRYRDLERLASFQNRVFAKFAADGGIPFLDVAAQMPRDPNLFVDPIHGTYDGIRLHAWIAAQGLASFLQGEIEKGRLPRASRSEEGDEHPAFKAPERTATVECRDTDQPGIKEKLVAPYANGRVIPSVPALGAESGIR